MNELLGSIGDVDVHDCGDLVKEALSKYSDIIDPKRVAVYGGSHGGFLTSWLIGHPEYKDLFSTGIIWNGVINLPY